MSFGHHERVDVQARVRQIALQLPARVRLSGMQTGAEEAGDAAVDLGDEEQLVVGRCDLQARFEPLRKALDGGFLQPDPELGVGAARVEPGRCTAGPVAWSGRPDDHLGPAPS